MVSTCLSVFALIPISFGLAGFKKANVALSRLVAESDIVLAGRVVQLRSSGTARLAVAIVDVPFKGVRKGQQITFLASPTWVCDTSAAVAGESVFLLAVKDDPADKQVREMDGVVESARRGLKGQSLYLIGWSGSGRIPITNRDGRGYIRGSGWQWGRDKALITEDQVYLPALKSVKLAREWPNNNTYSLAVTQESLEGTIRAALAPKHIKGATKQVRRTAITTDDGVA